MTQVNKEQMLRHFTNELEGGDAALFIGAGLSKASGFVDWKELMRDVATELGLDVERESDLIAVAQYHVNKRGGRAAINRLLIEEFTKDAELTQNHHLIASLPIRTIWTTNYDELLESAYRESHRRPDVKTTSPNLAQTMPQRDVVIYKMHGDTRQPQDAVLTKEDYETYQEKRELFSTALRGDLVERTFLFLGFSFTDPNIDYILSRIRSLLGQNQREHYCVMKWPDPPKDNSGAAQAEYEYSRRKLELRISDLSRYQIHAVMVNDYAEITEMLRELNRRTHRKDIFVSGSASAFDPFGKDRLERFLERLGAEIIKRGFNLVSGFGLGVGGNVVLGALGRIYEDNLPMHRLKLFPFPAQMADGPKRNDLFSKYRVNIMSNTGIVIFVSGNRADETAKSPSLAPGVVEEFELAHKLDKILVPLGATGWAAQQIWGKVSSGADIYKEPQRAADELRILGETGLSDDEYIEAIFKLITVMTQ